MHVSRRILSATTTHIQQGAVDACGPQHLGWPVSLLSYEQTGKDLQCTELPYLGIVSSFTVPRTRRFISQRRWCT